MPDGEPRTRAGMDDVLERISDGVVAYDHDWRFAYLNGAAERHSGRGLLGNAIKFTPPGGRVRLDAQASGADLVVRVANEGPGIEAEDLGRVFDRFWQGAKTRRAGVGLGLAIAKGIVEAHGGTMGAESTPGEWTTFTFTLPFTST
jgi:light-regulated signal transduction histidine kinase (bacteriophytochrome)